MPRIRYRVTAWYLLLVALVGGLALLAEARGITFGFLSRDPNNLWDGPFYAGALSNAGVLLWWAGACSACLAALVLRLTDRHSADVSLLRGAGLLSGLLALDDLFMVHELVGPTYLRIPELATLGLYGVLTAWWAWVHRAAIRRHAPDVLGYALAFFAISLIVDEVTPFLPRALLWEDGAKLIGIAGWTAWVCSLAYVRLRERIGESAEPSPCV